jgi:hypothetical protein
LADRLPYSAGKQMILAGSATLLADKMGFPKKGIFLAAFVREN